MHGVRETIERNICIGCGACSYATGGQLPIRLDRDGMYVASGLGVSDELYAKADAVCPFSDAAFNEDQISELVHDAQLRRHEFLGKYSKTYVGRVKSDEHLKRSSSGGLTSWVTQQMLDQGLADAVINVGHSEPSPPLFAYGVVGKEGISGRRKSRYYSTTMDETLALVRDLPGRYILVGVPCFIKAARLLEIEDPVLRKRIVFHVGLVCGHMKSQFFGESLAWQTGVPPDDIRNLDFRVKNSLRPASDYDFGVQSAVDGQWHFRMTKEMVGGNWGHAVFQPEACNFSDDIFAETADISFGDAWLPKYVEDWRGTNVVISRSSLADRLLEEGRKDGSIFLEDLGADEVASSQAGNFRHRRLGTSVRLADDKASGLSVPNKRVKPGYDGADAKRLAVIRGRRRLSALSFALFRRALEEGDLAIYVGGMRAEIRKQERLQRHLWRRAAGKVRRRLGRVRRVLAIR